MVKEACILLLYPSSTEVEHCARKPKMEGLILATDTWRKKMAKR
jgi:hypothetical protein